ncbi:hypothetical protein Y1Q_0009284 [Alligator mississippiensis]|uniref:Reverse transcriptase RNase H-like domain-containing protein n=1 Tax=Alligator mississippiensis TaxID=8496 RepID=A0A151NGM3_ALLMI|nr:hypothetical protein Y1Q_0009284 [Alligator mississippiensis]
MPTQARQFHNCLSLQIGELQGCDSGEVQAAQKAARNTADGPGRGEQDAGWETPTAEPGSTSPECRDKGLSRVDASGQALGAVLSQKVEGAERPVAYASRKLNDQERRDTSEDSQDHQEKALPHTHPAPDPNTTGVKVNSSWKETLTQAGQFWSCLGL